MKQKFDLEKSSSQVSLKYQHMSNTKHPSFLAHDNNESFDLTHTSLMTESWSPKIPAFEYLDLKIFKAYPCNNLNPHNYKTCCYFHNIKDKRRTNVNYASELCEYIEKNKDCPRGDMCNKSHNYIEVLYHPEKYKTKFCSFFPNNVHNCEYLQYCSFAHSEQEIVIDLIHNYDFDDDFYMFHYKTVWCPFNLSQHNKALCVYAHNWQDFRRRPDKYLYDYTPCEKWKNNEIILNYENGCPRTYECTKSHGWKESEFHPLNYKTRLCSISKPCTKSKDCPFYHSPAEKRTIPPLFENKFFCYVPRNRIITNTFKIKAMSRNDSMISSSFSLTPFLLKTNEDNNINDNSKSTNKTADITQSTKTYGDSTMTDYSNFTSTVQNSWFKREQEKAKTMEDYKRRASDPAINLIFGAKNEEQQVRDRFKTVIDKYRYDQSENLEKDIMKILVSDESEDEIEENQVFHNQNNNI